MAFARDGGGDGGGGSIGGGSGGSIPGRAGDRVARGSEDADRADARARDEEDEIERHAGQVSGRGHGRRRDRGPVDDALHVHAGREAHARHVGDGRVVGARVYAAVHSSVQVFARAHGRRRDGGHVGDELHVLAGRAGDARDGGDGRVGGARVDAAVHSNVQVAPREHDGRRDRGAVVDKFHVRGGRDANCRDGGDGHVGGARVDAAVHGDVQVAARDHGQRRHIGAVVDEVHVRAGRDADGRDGRDGRVGGALVDAAVHGDVRVAARAHGRRRHRGAVVDELHVRAGRDGDARDGGDGRARGAHVDAVVHGKVQVASCAQGRHRGLVAVGDEVRGHAGRDGDGRDRGDGRAGGARGDDAMPDDAEVAARAQGQCRDRGDVVDSYHVQQRPDSSDGDGRGGAAVVACRDAGGGAVDDDREVATRAQGRLRDRGAVFNESHVPAGTLVDAASSAVDGERDVVAVDGDGRVGASAQDRRRAGGVVVDGDHVKQGHYADTRDAVGGRDVGARAEATVDGDGHLATCTHDRRRDGGVVVDGVHAHRGQDAVTRDGVGGGAVDSRVDAAAHGDRHVVARARDRRHHDGAAGDVRHVATDVSAGDDRGDDGGSDCHVGGGQLGGVFSLLSAASASRHDHPLSKLDAEELRFILEALSSTCFISKPSRSGSSYVPCTDGAMQLSPPV